MIFGVFIVYYKGAINHRSYSYTTSAYTWGFMQIFPLSKDPIETWSTPIFLLENE